MDFHSPNLTCENDNMVQSIGEHENHEQRAYQYQCELELRTWVYNAKDRVHEQKAPPTCNTNSVNFHVIPLINSVNDFPFGNNLHINHCSDCFTIVLSQICFLRLFIFLYSMMFSATELRLSWEQPLAKY